MAAIREALGVDAALERGARGGFSVVVDARTVARRGLLGGTSSPEKVVGRVRRALDRA